MTTQTQAEQQTIDRESPAACGNISAKAPKIQIRHRRHLTVRPEIKESLLPFISEVRRKTKSGKYQTKTHYWRVKKGSGAIDGLQFAVDFMDFIKTNQRKGQAAQLIWHISQDMGNLYSGDWWCKSEFLDLIGAMLIFAAKHGDYKKFAEERLEELLQSEIHNPNAADCQAEADATKAGAA